MNANISHQLQQQIAQAYSANTPLSICGGGSKDFYGRKIQCDNIDVTAHSGIISYEPTALVITARSGTPLSEIENTLKEKGQILGF